MNAHSADHMSRLNRKVLVWDAPTRLFHWLVVALVVAAYTTWRLNWMDWHAWVGDALLTLLLFRLLWVSLAARQRGFPAFSSPRARLRDTSRMRFAGSPIAMLGTIQLAAGW
jgi:cytochrome b